jgi:hypothetical protein
MTVPHRLVHKSDRNDLRAVNGATPSVVVEDAPLTPTMREGMEKRLQKIEDVGANGRRLVVGCDGMYSIAISQGSISQIRMHERFY